MGEIPTSMRAVVLDAPGPPAALQICDVPVPMPTPGQVLIKVEALGLNRSELHTRLGLAEGVVFPRVLGIEATGVVVDCPGGELTPGTQVAAMMGGMGRTFDGGYAEYTCVPVAPTGATPAISRPRCCRISSTTSRPVRRACRDLGSIAVGAFRV